MKTGYLYSIILSLLINFSALGQISPGDLTDAHSGLEGMSNCTLCHDIGKKVSNTKCLDCHKEIRSLIANNKVAKNTCVKAAAKVFLVHFRQRIKEKVSNFIIYILKCHRILIRVHNRVSRIGFIMFVPKFVVMNDRTVHLKGINFTFEMWY